MSTSHASLICCLPVGHHRERHIRVFSCVKRMASTTGPQFAADAHHRERAGFDIQSAPKLTATRRKSSILLGMEGHQPFGVIKTEIGP
jgi:hypothetical protein